MVGRVNLTDRVGIRAYARKRDETNSGSNSKQSMCRRLGEQQSEIGERFAGLG